MADTYTVVSQRPTRDIGPTGQIADVVEIDFTTKPSNQPGKVRIPVASYTPDEVNRVLTQAARTIETIQTA